MIYTLDNIALERLNRRKSLPIGARKKDVEYFYESKDDDEE
jgi:hypothetical protein